MLRDSVNYTIHVTDASGAALTGNFSVSVTYDREVAVDTTSNIMASLLLSSDLRGHISEPAFYFNKTTQSAWALELLMLTQGWRRYDTERILKNNFAYPDTLLASGHEITGKVITGAFSEKPEANANVSVYSISGDYFQLATTDRNGRFYLHDGEMLDSTRFVIQSIPQSGKITKDLEVIIDDPAYPPRIIPVQDGEADDQNLFAEYVNKAEQQYIYQHGRRLIQLDEFTVTATKRPERRSSYYTYADASLTEEQIEKRPSGSVRLLLTRVPGVNVDNNGYAYVMSMSCRKQMILLDDFPFDQGIIKLEDLLQVDDITHIDVVRNNTVYGCIIAIYTKLGKNARRKKSFHIKSIVPLGFQKPVEFYAPKYDSPDTVPTPDLRTTIHWQPVLATDENGEASFHFYTADSPSTYTLTIEGVTDDGKPVYKREKMVVGDKK
jgi:hypothetical protein